MSSSQRAFLFESLEGKQPRNARKTHLRLLYDVLHLSLQRGDFARARRAWGILIRCKEIDWKAMWKTGLLLVDEFHDVGPEGNSKKLEFLSTMMLQCPDARQAIFQELVIRYISAGQYRKALDELELYLPSQPYESNPALHVYAGLICLYLAQPQQGIPMFIYTCWNNIVLRDAQGYFEKAKAIDSENLVATAWLEQVSISSATN
ncbi:hypothetical protein BXZ70DRAFT_896231 [Cristinia sonorae]|uniref:Uncharacterized protein n=1 Tax=Cristinia sonorae TaxID=1940300 RepID=A0A8K0XMY1_9AGAR|nr:hypothetical protein BXZ70DRAFT_896231 [Cristinia sonorae]